MVAKRYRMPTLEERELSRRVADLESRLAAMVAGTGADREVALREARIAELEETLGAASAEFAGKVAALSVSLTTSVAGASLAKGRSPARSQSCVIWIYCFGQLHEGRRALGVKEAPMRDPKHPGKLAEESKRRIVALYDGGKPAAETMREHDLGKSTLQRRARLVHETGSARAADNRTPEESRLLGLERENARLRMEVAVDVAVVALDVPGARLPVHVGGHQRASCLGAASPQWNRS